MDLFLFIKYFRFFPLKSHPPTPLLGARGRLSFGYGWGLMGITPQPHRHKTLCDDTENYSARRTKRTE